MYSTLGCGSACYVGVKEMIPCIGVAKNFYRLPKWAASFEDNIRVNAILLTFLSPLCFCIVVGLNRVVLTFDITFQEKLSAENVEGSLVLEHDGRVVGAVYAK